jgi:hypothetical protein
MLTVLPSPSFIVASKSAAGSELGPFQRATCPVAGWNMRGTFSSGKRGDTEIMLAVPHS